MYSFSHESEKGTVETFILCPSGDVVTGERMAAIVGKRAVILSPLLIRFVFALAWHVTRGRIPTAPGSWEGYSYPIPVEGSKLTTVTGYTYQYSGIDALQYTDGAYEYVVPPTKRVHKPTYV